VFYQKQQADERDYETQALRNRSETWAKQRSNHLWDEPYKKGAQNSAVKGNREGVAEQSPFFSHDQETSQIKNHR